MSNIVRAKLDLPASIRERFAAEASEITKRIGAPTGSRIRLTQKKTFRLPDGTETADPIQGVILDFISINSFYTSVFDPDDIQPPECFAIGFEKNEQLVPHTTSPNTQGANCTVCPNNQFGTAARGKGKACQNTKLLAVLPPDANEDSPIWLMKVSATALRSFDAYVNGLAAKHAVPPRAVVTEFSLDPKPDYPSLRFETLDANPIMDLCDARYEEARKLLSTPPEVRVPTEAPKKAGVRRARA